MDDVGPVIGEEPSRHRTRDPLRQLDDSQALEGAVRGRTAGPGGEHPVHSQSIVALVPIDQGTGPTGVLTGLKVVELAQLVAGGMPGSLLADFGADVVHVEDPGSGDLLRGLGPEKEGINLWWKVAGRNKRLVSIDLRHPEGQALARRLAAWADVVVTNFRAGTLERWQLDFPSLQRLNPTLIMLQISALGATGPARDVPGFGKIGEARSGAAHLSGSPDGGPVFAGYLLSDAATALMGALAVQMALYRRAHNPEFRGEWIDDTLSEPLFRLIDWQVVVHDQLGVIPTRTGGGPWITEPTLTRTAATADGRWIVISASALDEVRALAGVVGQDACDSWDEVGRRRQALDVAVDAWIIERAADAALAILAEAGVVAAAILDIADIFADPTYAEREDIITVADPDLGPVRMQTVIPRFVNHPGTVWRCGASVGEDNRFVLQEFLGLSEDDCSTLAHSGALGPPPSGIQRSETNE
ncbi:MAG: hypothetical protein QOG64_2294 [Acidimicrobiaceae bacterium]|nr:hypothetical protein [Acidimicrobiaceae bacterium]